MFRSNRGVFAQLIDDDAGRTLAAVNWTEDELKSLKRDGAGQQGRRAARRARQGRRRRDARSSTAADTSYHGRVKALAEGAREGGLIF